MTRDESCTCKHGGVDAEDHTVDNGCETRGCTCTYWPITFENTRNQIIKWYAVTGAPVMKHGSYPSAQPTSARFTFYFGEECTEIVVYGKTVRKDGSISKMVRKIEYIYHWNQTTWPQWLHDLYKLALSENQAEARQIKVLV